MDIENALHFENPGQWRAWLAANHDKETRVWLLHIKKHTGKPTMSLEEAINEALCFGWIDGKLRSIDSEKYALSYTPRKAGSVWSLINKKRAEMLLAEGRMTPAGLAAIEAAKKRGLWQAAYTSRARTPLPEDTKKALVDDSQAWENFQKFAPSYRNNYIGWVGDAKTEATRARRIAAVVNRASLNLKPGMS